MSRERHNLRNAFFYFSHHFCIVCALLKKPSVIGAHGILHTSYLLSLQTFEYVRFKSLTDEIMMKLQRDLKELRGNR